MENAGHFSEVRYTRCGDFMRLMELQRFVVMLREYIQENSQDGMIDRQVALDETHIEFCCRYDTEWEIEDIPSDDLSRELDLAGVYWDKDLDLLMY